MFAWYWIRKNTAKQFSITTIGCVSNNVSITNEGTNIEFNTDDVFGKDKEKIFVRKETKFILFHPKVSRFTTTTSVCKKNSNLFICGTLHIINKVPLLELNNINFIPSGYVNNNVTSTHSVTNHPKSNLAKQMYNQLQQ